MFFPVFKFTCVLGRNVVSSLKFTCVLGRNVVSSLISTQIFRRALTASVDSCAEIKIECPFSGVTNSGRVWRKVPESDALEEGAGKRCSECVINLVPFGDRDFTARKLL